MIQYDSWRNNKRTKIHCGWYHKQRRLSHLHFYLSTNYNLQMSKLKIEGCVLSRWCIQCSCLLIDKDSHSHIYKALSFERLKKNNPIALFFSALNNLKHHCLLSFESTSFAANLYRKSSNKSSYKIMRRVIKNYSTTMEPNLNIILSSKIEKRNKYKFIRHTCISAPILKKEFCKEGATRTCFIMDIKSCLAQIFH